MALWADRVLAVLEQSLLANSLENIYNTKLWHLFYCNCRHHSWSAVLIALLEIITVLGKSTEKPFLLLLGEMGRLGALKLWLWWKYNPTASKSNMNALIIHSQFCMKPHIVQSNNDGVWSTTVDHPVVMAQAFTSTNSEDAWTSTSSGKPHFLIAITLNGEPHIWH